MLELILKLQERKIYKLKEKALDIIKKLKKDYFVVFNIPFHCNIYSTLGSEVMPDVYIYSMDETLFKVTTLQKIHNNKVIIRNLRLYLKIIKTNLSSVSVTKVERKVVLYSVE